MTALGSVGRLVLSQYMMRLLQVLGRPAVLATLLALPLTLLGGSAAAAPRYFMKLGEVEFAPGAVRVSVPREAPSAPPAPDGLPPPTVAPATPAPAAPAASADSVDGPVAKDERAGTMAQDYLREALKRRPEVTLELGAPLDNPDAVKAELKRRNLRAYSITLRILRQERTVKPAPAGKKFRLLEQNVRLSLVGSTFPDKVLALGGDGESTVQIDVGSPINERQESEVLSDALKDAIEQAVKQGMAKLIAGPPKAPKSPPRKPKAK